MITEIIIPVLLLTLAFAIVGILAFENFAKAMRAKVAGSMRDAEDEP